MIRYFDIQVEKQMIKHAQSEYPNECCGYIVNDKYIPSKNIADDPLNFMRFDPRHTARFKNIQCMIHSHVDYIKDGKKYHTGHASKPDMISQMKHQIPYGIVHLNHRNTPQRVFYFGDKLPVQDLKGRPFIHGLYDCYGLVRDYYRKELNIILKNYPRDFGWWNIPGNSSMLLDYFEDAGFVDKQITLDNIQKNDVFYTNIMGHTVNHCGVYTGNGLLLHHLYGRLSLEVPLMIYKNNVSKIIRHKEFI